MDITIRINEVAFSEAFTKSYLDKGNDFKEAFWFALEQTLKHREIINPLHDMIVGRISEKSINMFETDYETSLQ